MCQICTGEYDANTIELYCQGCPQVTSIPSTLVNLQYLYCYNTNVTSIPSTLVNLRILACRDTNVTSIPDTLIKLRVLDCSSTSILFIPDLPNLRRLYCNNTPVTCIPSGLQYLSSDNCKWLVLENISKLIPIQKRFKNKFKTRRSNELSEYFYPDIISLIL
jgi:Leucine-rich repeat (LRR) protein